MTTAKKTLDVYEIGTEVSLTEEISAKIITVAIHSDNVIQYECAWWSGESRTREWFAASDFFKVGEQKAPVKIGFLR